MCKLTNRLMSSRLLVNFGYSIQPGVMISHEFLSRFECWPASVAGISGAFLLVICYIVFPGLDCSGVKMIVFFFYNCGSQCFFSLA